MNFAHPENLWLLVVLAPLIAWYILKQKGARPTLGVSSLLPFGRSVYPMKAYLRHILFVLRLATVAAVIFILARPQSHNAWSTSRTEGTDIVLVMDVSSSMLARDFRPNRFSASKAVAKQFVNARENDNLGLVVFAGEALTGVPMTGDRAVLLSYIDGVREGMLSDGTAIGDGIATALNRLKEGKAKSKSIILITDGSNNTGLVSPKSAAEIAQQMGVKVYTVGIGTNGMAPFPSIDEFGRISYPMTKVEIDEATLRQVAEMTKGKYFRATGNKVLQDVFAEIDRLEKTQLDVRHFSHTEDDYMLWAWLAFGFFALELVLRYTVFRSIP